MNKNFSFFIWNIHGLQGYNNYQMPEFVIDEILSQEKDIVILTEFIRTNNWNSISRKLAKKYWRYTYRKHDNTNEILILVKKGFNNIDDSLLKKIKPQMMPSNNQNPNLLQISIQLSENSNLYIIGLRIRDDEHTVQFDLLNDYLSSINIGEKDVIFCGGDFNEWKTPVSKKLTFLNIHSPKMNLGNNPFPKTSAKDSTISTWSAVLTDKKNNTSGKALIDLVATKNCDVNEIDDYYWGFVNEANGYGKLTSSDVLSQVLYHPDHAILRGKFKYI